MPAFVPPARPTYACNAPEPSPRPPLHIAIAGLRAGPLFSHPEETLEMPALLRPYDADVEMAWVPGHEKGDVMGEPKVAAGRRWFGRAWVGREVRAPLDGGMDAKEVAVSYAYEEKGRVGRMTVGSWIAMLLLLALSAWVILHETL